MALLIRNAHSCKTATKLEATKLAPSWKRDVSVNQQRCNPAAAPAVHVFCGLFRSEQRGRCPHRHKACIRSAHLLHRLHVTSRWMTRRWPATMLSVYSGDPTSSTEHPSCELAHTDAMSCLMPILVRPAAAPRPGRSSSTRSSAASSQGDDVRLLPGGDVLHQLLLMLHFPPQFSPSALSCCSTGLRARCARSRSWQIAPCTRCVR